LVEEPHKDNLLVVGIAMIGRNIKQN